MTIWLQEAMTIASLIFIPSKYINVHQDTQLISCIRKGHRCIGSQYTLDVFLIYTTLLLGPSPSTSSMENLVPMNTAGLIEASFADGMRAIENATDLKPQTRTHWCCSLRQIAIALDNPWSSFRPAGQRCGRR